MRLVILAVIGAVFASGFGGASQEETDLALIQDALNHMPRKLHNWKPAQHVYTMLCRNHR